VAESASAAPAQRTAAREVIFLAMVLAIFLASVEATIVATAMPTIVADLGGLRLFSWVFGAYFLTQAVGVPIYGRLADQYGRKPMLIAAILIFLTGSILSGFARNMVTLIAFRALQGVGAGGVLPMAQTVVGDLYPGRERAQVQGFLSSIWGVAAIIGPLLGAFLVQHLGWPTIFWINVPFGLACIAIVLRFFHERVRSIAHAIDYPGSFLLAIGVGGLMFVLVMAGKLSAAATVALTLFSLGVIAVLLIHEARAREPILPLELYRHPVIALANGGSFAIGAMLMGVSAFLPTYVQGAMGRTAVVAGTVLGVQSIAWVAGSFIGARLMIRTSYRLTAVTGGISTIVGSAFLATLTPERGTLWASLGCAFIGLGFGFVNGVFIIATQSSVGWEQRGRATASNIFQRQLGQSIGTALFGAVFNIGIYARIPDAGDVLGRLMVPQGRAQFAPAVAARDASAIASAVHPIYLILGGVAVVLLFTALALPARLRPDNHPAPA
jgi:EmrB/QacA subfamily drug resistance transporter